MSTHNLGSDKANLYETYTHGTLNAVYSAAQRDAIEQIDLIRRRLPRSLIAGGATLLRAMAADEQSGHVWPWLVRAAITAQYGPWSTTAIVEDGVYSTVCSASCLAERLTATHVSEDCGGPCGGHAPQRAPAPLAWVEPKKNCFGEQYAWVACTRRNGNSYPISDTECPTYEGSKTAALRRGYAVQ